MSIWQDIKCGIFGHSWTKPLWQSGADQCMCCGEQTEGVKHRVPPMPEIKPPRIDVDMQILAELKAIRAVLEAQNKPVQYEFKASASHTQHNPTVQRGGIA
jgi:hypothetical protein